MLVQQQKQVNPEDCLDFIEARKYINSDFNKSIFLFKKLITKKDDIGIYNVVKENSIYELCKLYIKENNLSALTNLLTFIRPFFNTISKSKTTKIVRKILKIVISSTKCDKDIVLSVYTETIKWCIKEKRAFLRQRLELNKSGIMLNSGDINGALKLLKKLTDEIKKYDDKLLLMESHLLECKIHLALDNFPIAKSSLTASKSISNSIYCPPEIQAEIDLNSGIISLQEKDFKTAYSYFFESFDTFCNLKNEEKSISTLKYMILSKILSGKTKEAINLLKSKTGIKFANEKDILAMKEIANAYNYNSLTKLRKVLKMYEQEIKKDKIINNHMTVLYESLLENNLLKIIHPFSSVELKYIAELVEIDVSIIEKKLSKLIHENKINGMIDLLEGNLIINRNMESYEIVSKGILILKELHEVMNCISRKAEKVK